MHMNVVFGHFYGITSVLMYVESRGIQVLVFLTAIKEIYLKFIKLWSYIMFSGSFLIRSIIY